MAVFNAGAAGLMALLDLVSPPVTASPVGRWIGLAAPCFGSLNALLMFWLSSNLEPRRLMAVAPVFQVMQGFFISVYYHTAPIALKDATRGWSAVVVWIIIFPLLIPNTRRRVWSATLATAAMDPVGLWIQSPPALPLRRSARWRGASSRS